MRFARLLIAALACCSASAAGAAGDAPLNIVLIVADDLGYSDPGFMGGDIDTPTLDRLAQEGVLFEHFYNNAKCSQTRASLLSGLWYQEARKPGPMGNPGHDQLARSNHTTLAEVLNGAGYATAMAGKWHLAGTPRERGFERFYGMLEGSWSHWDPSQVFGDFVPQEPFYSTDAYTSAAIDFLAEAQASGRPAFLYLAYTAPHYPLHAPAEEIDKYRTRFRDGWDAVRARRLKHLERAGFVDAGAPVAERSLEPYPWDGRREPWRWDALTPAEQDEQALLMATYAAMVERLDRNVGRLLAALERLGMEEDTIVFFLSDNGASPYTAKDEADALPGPEESFRTLNTAWAEVSSTPLRLFKRYNHEGGIATPMIAWGRGVAAPGRRTRDPWHVVDFMPTLVELAGAAYPATRYGDPVLPPAGRSFARVLENRDAEASPRRLYWEYAGNRAVRDGGWKLAWSALAGAWELYDLAADPGETNDLAAQYPERVARLATDWQHWFDGVSEPAPPWQLPGAWPDRIVATPAADPAHAVAVTWRTHAGIGDAVAEIVRAGAEARFEEGATQVRANTETLDLSSALARAGAAHAGARVPAAAWHSVTFDGLAPDTTYAYRVGGAEGYFSAWRQLRTAPETGPFEFLFFGDAQQGIRSHVSRVFEAAGRASPQARFLLHAGDLVDQAADDRQWAEWFAAGGALLQGVPSLPVPGNHDYLRTLPGEPKVAKGPVTPLWRPQFALPVEEALPESLHELAYSLRYHRDLELFAVDTTAVEFDVQMDWLAGELCASDATWRIVFMHHPYFSFVGDGEEEPEQTRRRARFDEVLSKCRPDLVLTGHRHSYQRADSGAGVAQADRLAPYEVETVYVVTASTANRGTTKVSGWDDFTNQRNGTIALTRWLDDVPLFGIVHIDSHTLRFRAVDALGEVRDEFVLERGRERNVLRNGAAALASRGYAP